MGLPIKDRYRAYWLIRGALTLLIFFTLFTMYWKYVFVPLFLSSGVQYETKEDVINALRDSGKMCPPGVDCNYQL